MKHLIFLLTFLLTALSLRGYAQAVGTLSGTITTEDSTPIGFANVVLVQAADYAFVAGMVADADGNFTLPSPAKGNYILRVNALGYTGWASAPFEVSGPGYSKSFGNIQLKDDSQQLKEVTVQAFRPAIVQHPDKMVVNVEGTALSAGNTAFEVLSKAPGVFVDQEGNIKLNGKGGAQLMLNGKMTYLSAKELRAMLQAMSAENIKDIELISNPSARHDAEGTAGIININLKKNYSDGLNGSVYAGYQYNELSGYAAGGNINYKKGRLSSFATLDVARRPNLRENDINRIFSNPASNFSFNQKGREEGYSTTPSLRLGIDYDLNARHSIGAMANIVMAQEENEFITNSILQFYESSDDLFIRSDNTRNSQLTSSTFNFHYLGKLDTMGTTLSADLDYVKLVNETDQEFINQYQQSERDLTERNERLGSENPVYYDIYSAKVDYVKPFRNAFKLEVGAKASHVVSDNNLQFFQFKTDERIPDSSRSNHFIYEENILAGYANVSGKLNKTWSVQGGLRAEQTFSRGNSLTLEEQTSRSYLDLFPSLFLQQQVGEEYQISYQYSRRINRPRYDDLNPFIYFLDPYTLARGNPYLRPQYTNSFQMVHTLKSSYSMTLGYANTRNYIAEIPMQQAQDTTTVFQKQNVESFRNISATFVAPVSLSPEWQMNNVLNVSHQHFITDLDGKQVENSQLYYLIQSNHNVQLPAGIRMEVSAAYQGPMAYGVYQVKPLWWMDAGFKRSFMNEKLDVSLNLTDIFRSRILKGDFSNEGNLNSFDQYRGSQGVRVQLRYRFSKGEKFESKRRNSTLDELDRADKQ